MISSYLKKNKSKAFHYGYRPDEIKQKETFNDSELTFTLVSLAPQNLLQFSLGSDIIFNQLRKEPGTYVDMSVLYDKRLLSLLRGNLIKGLYSERDVREFDIVGLSLYFIGSYFNVIPFLIYSGIEPYSKNRKELKPLIIAGGISVSSNPEPISEFVDLFIIGDGETPVKLLASFYKENRDLSKELFLKKIKDVHNCFYIPSLKSTKTVFYNIESSLENSILNFDDYVSKPTRKTIELIRGCYYKCNFCQLSNIKNKVLEMPIDKVIDTINSYPDGTILYPFAPDESSYKHYDKIYENLGNRKLYRYNQRFNTFKNKERLSSTDYRIVFGVDGISDRIRNIVNKRIKLNDIYSSLEDCFKNFSIIKMNYVIAYPFEINKDWEEFDKFLDKILQMRLDISPDNCLSIEENKQFNILYNENKKKGKKSSIRDIKKMDDTIMIDLAPTPFQAEPHTPMQWFGIGNIKSARNNFVNIQKKYMKKYGMIKIEGLNSEGAIEIGFIIKRGGKELCNIFYEMAQRGYYNNNGLSTLIKPFKIILKNYGIDYKKYLQPIKFGTPLVWDFIKTGLEDQYKEKYIKMIDA